MTPERLCTLALILTALPAAVPASAAGPVRSATGRPPLVFVITGESNSGGIAPNAAATAAELAPRSCVQIMNLTSGAFGFEDLRIGVNNLRDHVGMSRFYAGSHGWELELANAVDEGAFPDRTRVYLIKTGQGGSVISQWAEGQPYWKTFLSRIAAGRKQVPANARWVVWMSLGINDALRKTPVPEWKTAMVAHMDRIDRELPEALIVLTGFQSMGYPEVNRAMGELVAQRRNAAVIDSTGAGLVNDNHWDYAGAKLVTRRLIAATLQLLGEAPAPAAPEAASSAGP